MVKPYKRMCVTCLTGTLIKASALLNKGCLELTGQSVSPTRWIITDSRSVRGLLQLVIMT
jgi:hypothetical protein